MSQTTKSEAATLAEPVPQNSPEFPKVNLTNSPNDLSQQQLAAIDGILAGLNQTEIAAKAGVDRKTLYNWRDHDAGFHAEVRRRQELLWRSAVDRLRALVPKAVAALKDDLACGQRTQRGRAAAAILRFANVRTAVAMKPPAD